MSAEPSTTTRPLRADARRNRDRLVTAARAVLLARGGDASMEEIAKAADVGIGTLYRHFPRRIDLVEAVYRDDVDALVVSADEATTGADPWDALGTWLDGFVRYAQSKRNLLTELHEAFEKDPGLALSSRDRLRRAVGLVLARAQEAGVARTDIDGADVMQLISGMCMARDATLDQNERLLRLILDGIRVS